MKKFLALFLVLIMAFSCVLVSCVGSGDGDGDTTTTDDGGYIGIPTPPPASTPAPTTPAPVNPDDFTWTEGAGELVYIKAPALSVRNTTSTGEGTLVGTVYFGESFARGRYNSVWTEITYKGNKCYVATHYITTDAGTVLFDAVDAKVMYVNVEKTLFLRTSTLVYDVNGEKIDDPNNVVVNRGAQVEMVGISRDGTWAKVKFEGSAVEFLYCNTEYLSETKPSDQTQAPAVTSPSFG